MCVKTLTSWNIIWKVIGVLVWRNRRIDMEWLNITFCVYVVLICLLIYKENSSTLIFFCWKTSSLKKLITPFRKLGSLLRRNCDELSGYFRIKNNNANLTHFVFKLWFSSCRDDNGIDQNVLFKDKSWCREFSVVAL